jgi:hypothetical protein
MDFLLSSSFNAESVEGKELISRIQTSYINENKEEFLNIGEEIADLVFVRGIDSEDQVTNLLGNVYKVMVNLTEMQAIAFTQILIKIRRDGKSFNDILGDSDDIFRFLMTVSKKIDVEKIEEGIKIKRGEAFFQQ